MPDSQTDHIRPWLSVVMPTFNGAMWIRESLESICRQDDPQIEVLVVDDGSTDATLDCVAEYVDRLPLRIIRRPHSGNWTASVNQGMAEAMGEFIGWLHQDDVWEPGRLKKLRGILEKFPDADIVLHPSYFMDSVGRRVGRWTCPLPCEHGFLAADRVRERLLVQNFIASCAPVFRAAAARLAGPVDERLWYTADWDYWLRLIATGRTLFCPTPLLSVRLHGESQTIRRAAGNGMLQQQFQIVLDRHLIPWTATDSRRKQIARRAEFSCMVNLTLAGWQGFRRFPLRRLLVCFLQLGPRSACCYLRDSGIVQRVSSRLFAGIRLS